MGVELRPHSAVLLSLIYPSSPQFGPQELRTSQYGKVPLNKLEIIEKYLYTNDLQRPKVGSISNQLNTVVD